MQSIIKKGDILRVVFGSVAILIGALSLGGEAVELASGPEQYQEKYTSLSIDDARAMKKNNKIDLFREMSGSALWIAGGGWLALGRRRKEQQPSPQPSKG